MLSLVIHPMTRPLTGSVPLPADKSISHRALLLAAIATGKSKIIASAHGEDNVATLSALRSMGVEIDVSASEISVSGVGLYGLQAPSGPIHCGNSGTTMRLLAGLLCGQRFATTLTGDASLTRRPMERVLRPLRLRGARVEGQLDAKKPGECTAPLHIGPLPEPSVLGPLEYELPVASAQVKSAILLSGLYAHGPTVVCEPVLSRDHTERMFSALGIPIRAMGPIAQLDSDSFSGKIPAFNVTVPGDLSAAAFLLAAALMVPESRVDLRNVGLNPTRAGIFDVLRDMGATFETEARGESLGEPFGLVRAVHSNLTLARVGGEIVGRAIDEIPIICGLAARAAGSTKIHDAAELRVKESDRISAMADVLRAFGVACEEKPDGLVIHGKPDGALKAATVNSRGDHRIAMTAAVLGLVADGPSRVLDADNIRTSFPRFVGTLRALGASIDVEEKR